MYESYQGGGKSVYSMALKMDESITSEAYKDLRTALIQSVRDIHVEHSEVSDKLFQMAAFLKCFKTVVSLNYDFLVYWAMLAGNNKWGPWFKDCFVNGTFDEDWERFRKAYRGAKESTLVFYPHGNLILASDLSGDEQKIVSGERENLLDTVVGKWESGDYTPLFVSEGTSKQKIQAINRSPYLGNVYNSVLGRLGSNIVAFGWSMRDQDNHILEAICSNKDIEALAVSVIVSEDVESRCTDIKRKISQTEGANSIEIVFFDAESMGCWLNPASDGAP